MSIGADRTTWKSIFRMKASPGRGKLSPQVTDEGAGKQLLPENDRDAFWLPL